MKTKVRTIDLSVHYDLALLYPRVTHQLASIVHEGMKLLHFELEGTSF